MCRMTLFNRSGKDYLEKRIGLAAFFQYLENRQGGHGNGIAIMDRKGNIVVRKGVDFTPVEAARFVKMTRGEWYLFHTRLASAGEVCDRNCHPFQFPEGVVAMNGTIAGFSALGELLGSKTDTEALLHTLRALYLPMPEALAAFRAAWLGFWKGVPFAIASGLVDMELIRGRKSIIFASEFPPGIGNIFSVKPGFFWHGGKFQEDMLVAKSQPKQKQETRYTVWRSYRDDPWEDYLDYLEISRSRKYESALERIERLEREREKKNATTKEDAKDAKKDIQ